jgi:hypothetical protein
MQHQIVITLNPEEYREIQRLAKMAGTTSIGQFLHTRLLTFLGMRNSNRRLDTTYDTEHTVDLTQLGDTITRMHKELQQLLETGEISGYVTGTAPVEDIRDDFISFKFETILQNDYNATPSQPVYLSAETVFNQLGVTLPSPASSSSEEFELTIDSLPPPPESASIPVKTPTPVSSSASFFEPAPVVESVPEPAPVPVPVPVPAPAPAPGLESIPVKSEDPAPEVQPEIQPKDRKVDFRIKPQTAEEAIQAAKSIEDELERLADEAFAQTPFSGASPVPDTQIEPLAADDPLVDILDEGLVKILEGKTASKITSDFVKPKLEDMPEKKAKELEQEQEPDTDEDPPSQPSGFGPPPKKRKK